jgi:hypothetical protein
MSEAIIKTVDLLDHKNQPASVLKINHDILIKGVVKKAFHDIGTTKKEILTYPLWSCFLENKTNSQVTDIVRTFILTDGEINTRKPFIKILQYIKKN